MIALATRYDVSTHVASSIVAERLPAMCGSDTLTTVVSSTSMKVANITEIAMSQGLIDERGSMIREITSSIILYFLVFRIHRRRHRHARPQQMLGILTRVEHDLHGHALHDLHEVAGRVFRRQQAEARAGRAGDAVDLAR